MFTVVAQKGLSDAKRYFAEHLSRNDYYAAQELRPGQWIGEGVERLGLNRQSTVAAAAFEALCENRHPITGERLTLRQNASGHRRVFYDFTCSAPKSVSILAVTLNDERLVTAHEAAVQVAFRELESFASTRVRRQGLQEDRPTGTLVAAQFTHTTSRALDPQLHTHCTVFNATWDAVERSWKALQAGGIYDAIRFGTEVYRNELARRVLDLGYRIVPAEHGFEVAGVRAEILQRFSKRAAQRDAVVQAMAEQLGRELTPNEVSRAVHRSRPKKLSHLSTVEVRRRHLEELSTAEQETLTALIPSVTRPTASEVTVTATEAVQHAVAHVFERHSVAPEHEVLESALVHGRGQVLLADLRETLRGDPQLMATSHGLAHREALKLEHGLIAAIEDGKATSGPLHASYVCRDDLGDDQRRALQHLLTSTDRVFGLRGMAGTGKTTVLRELDRACRQTGHELRFCAPTAAATEVLRRESFAACTLEAFLRDASRRPTSPAVVVLDEAGAVGIDDMSRLLRLGTRVILVGDTGQHGAVQRGDALRLLENHSPFAFGQLDQIRRQRRADYRHIVHLAATQQTAAAFRELERLGHLTELPAAKVHEEAARAYAEAGRHQRSALLVAPTWTEIAAVTKAVRHELQNTGTLGREEHEFQVLNSLSWTEAQKRDVRQFRPGLDVRFLRKHGDIRRDECVRVVEVEGRTVRVQWADGAVIPFNPAEGSPVIDVGELHPLRVAAGDRLLLRGNRARRFHNGELVTVQAIVDGAITLSDGRTLPRDYNTFTHGYAVTSHAAQGKTVDAVFIVASTRSLAAVHRQQFYVSVSRGRDECRVFTDDVELLRRHVTDSSTRLAAIEAVASVQSSPTNELRPPRRRPSLAMRVAQQVAQRAARVPWKIRETISVNANPQPGPILQRRRGHSLRKSNRHHP